MKIVTSVMININISQSVKMQGFFDSGKMKVEDLFNFKTVRKN